MYKTILKYGEDRFEEKRSEFIGYAQRVESEEEARAFVDKIKAMHKQATHNVYAYIIGENMGIQRYSDDGEPQGTAGVPVLDCIKKKGLTNVAVVVTRYFGGVLLGTGGLVRAYSHGAAIALEAGEPVEKVLGRAVYFKLSYDLYGKIQYLCGTNDWHIEDSVFTDEVEVKIYFESDIIEDVKKSVIEATNGKVVIREDDEVYYYKMENRLYPEV